MRRLPHLLACLVLLAASGLARADAVTDRARALLDAGQAKEAYGLLLPLETERAGNVDYDYLLGVAALDAGDTERAVFALERVLAVQPDHLQARAEIGRAFVAQGDREGARRELLAVRASSPPPEVQKTIDRFLDAISRPPTRFAGFVEGTFGFDSNINSATGSGSLAIPAIGTVALGPGLTRLSAPYLGLAAGGSVAYPLNESWTAVGGLRGALKLNGGGDLKSQFDTASVDLDAGLRWARDKQNSFTFGFQAQTFALDNTRFRDSTGVIAQWQRQMSETRELSVFGQHTELRYPGQSVRDADRDIIGAALAQSFGGRYAPVLFVSGYAGSERERAAGVPQLGHTPFGARVGVQATLQPDRLFFNAFAGYEERRYGGPEPLFGVSRKDRQADLRAGLTWKLRDGWSVNPQVSYTDNRSNVALFKYDRALTSISLRKDF